MSICCSVYTRCMSDIKIVLNYRFKADMYIIMFIIWLSLAQTPSGHEFWKGTGLSTGLYLVTNWCWIREIKKNIFHSEDCLIYKNCHHYCHVQIAITEIFMALLLISSTLT